MLPTLLLLLGFAHLLPSLAAPAPAPPGAAAPAGPFQLVPLPYAYDAMEPVIDTETMHLHHDKHMRAYVAGLNTALAAPSGAQHANQSLQALLGAAGAGTLPPELDEAVQHNGGGAYNHHFFFYTLQPYVNETNRPTGELGQAIDNAFGNFSNFQAQFSKAAASRFGSGFAWLIYSNNALSITSTPNQLNPLMSALAPAAGYQAGIPLLTLDVWEHAYYLLYKNLRPDYIRNWWQVVDFEQAEANYQNAKRGLSFPQS